MLLADPVGGRLAVFKTPKWRQKLEARPAGGAIASRALARGFGPATVASPEGNRLFARAFVTGGKGGSVFYSRLADPE